MHPLNCYMTAMVLLLSGVFATADEPAWKLVWSDEFSTGTRPDTKKWAYEVGGNGWGNVELQTYTTRSENARVEDGNLVIEARAEPWTGTDGIKRDYTSARLKTAGKASWTYGRIEARIKIPKGQGLWPAFWALGSNFNSVGWPTCGELDIMENIGREPSTVHGVMHGPGYSGDIGKQIDRTYTLSGGKSFGDDFHVYAIEWEQDRIQWFVDGIRFSTITPSTIPAGKQWAFNKSFFLILNVAVGGRWPGSPNTSTKFPQRMLVDYIRVYQRTTAPAPLVRLEVFPDRVEARWPLAYPQALLDRSSGPDSPWVLWKTDGRRSDDEFIAVVTPGLYRLRWTP